MVTSFLKFHLYCI